MTNTPAPVTIAQQLTYFTQLINAFGETEETAPINAAILTTLRELEGAGDVLAHACQACGLANEYLSDRDTGFKATEFTETAKGLRSLANLAGGAK